MILDLRSSHAHRAGHPAGSRWAIRPRLAEAAAGAKGPLHIFAADPTVAALAAADLAELGRAEVALIAGGMAEWRAAGLAIEATPDRPSDAEAIDYLWFVHDRHDGNLDASRAYLAWEEGLIAQLDAEERAAFALSA
jgi:rhodanese-related sulfurtransferase